MRFRGLAANDPAVAQYQLWIFDAERNEAYPVDGGVFDVPAKSDGDVVIKIDPRLPVSRATAFAITVEQPGGVVVSSRERLPLLAALQ
jgi:anti-sigma-K factor RskA